MESTIEDAAIIREKDEEILRLKDRIKWLERALFSSRSERIIGTHLNQGEFEDLLAELEDLSNETRAKLTNPGLETQN